MIPESPDFDKMFEVAKLVGDLKTKAELLKISLKQYESEIMREVMVNPAYFKGEKKPLAFNVIQIMYLHTGFNNELIPARKELAEVEGKLEKAELLFRTLQDKVKVFQTESSNLRGSLV